VADVTLTNVTKAFGKVAAVRNVSLQIDDGEFLVLVGPSGCGKTTLLRMLAGLEAVSEGVIQIGGRDVTALPPRQRDIAMVFQDYALYPHLTVAENLGIGLKLRGVSRGERKRRVAALAPLLGLEGLLDRKPGQLSGGQQQRVAIGRAMIREPLVYLMDEPLSNLDAKLRVQMRAELARLRDQLRVTTVYVTHDQVEAMTLGDRVAVLRDGILQQVATAQELFEQPANVFVAGFIGSPEMNLVHAEIDDGRVCFGGHALPVPRDALTAGRRHVIVGMRPTDFLVRPPQAADAATMAVDVEVVEMLGAEMRVVFLVNARSGADAAIGDDRDDGELPLLRMGVDVAGEVTTFTAALPADPAVTLGTRLHLAVNTQALHFFDPDTGAALRQRRPGSTVRPSAIGFAS
jgi:multiple sugar transport system ATP-binding protein